jgi:hypothetical protein
MLATLRNPAAQAVRNLLGGLLLGLAPVRDAMAQNFSETTIGYPDSPLNGTRVRGLDGPAPGERLAPTPAGTPGVPRPASGAPRFALHAARSPALDDLISRHAAILEPAPRPALRDEGVWLIRPDGYVAAVAAATDPGSLDPCLAGIVGSQGDGIPPLTAHSG